MISYRYNFAKKDSQESIRIMKHREDQRQMFCSYKSIEHTPAWDAVG